MKTIGIIGGLSPASTVMYYQWLNDGTREKLGGHHSAKIILWSVDFAEFCVLKEKGDGKHKANFFVMLPSNWRGLGQT